MREAEYEAASTRTDPAQRAVILPHAEAPAARRSRVTVTEAFGATASEGH